MAAAGGLSDEERRALRGSKMAHSGGPLTTNKAAALAKFLQRKLQQPDGLDSLNPDLVKLAVKNAKETIKASKGEPSTSGRVVRHVSLFGDCSEVSLLMIASRISSLCDPALDISEYQDSEVSKDEAEVKGIKRKRENKKSKAYQDSGEQSKKKKKKKKKKCKVAKASMSQKTSKKRRLRSL